MDFGEIERIFKQMELRVLPVATEAFIAVVGLVRRPVGALIVAALGIGLFVLASRGAFDRFLKKLVRADVFGIAGLIAFAVLSL
jgi:hypothetical protein